MVKEQTTKTELLRKIAELENKLVEAEETIEAIKYDKVDALVISTSDGDAIYTLKGADKPYRIFLEEMNEGAVTISNEGFILFCNRAFADLIKLPMESIVGKDIIEFAYPADLERLRAFLAADGKFSKLEINLLCSDNSPVTTYLSLTRLNIEGLEPVLCVIATDLTEKKKNEEIVAAEKLARSILEQSSEAILVCDENMYITRANKAAEVLAAEPVLFKQFDFVFPLEDKKKNKIPVFTLVDKINTEPEMFFCNKNKQKIHLIINIGKLKGQQAHILGYVVNLTNITQHISSEEKLTASLKEKTVLLREIHHRVKNNLQIVSSLLSLQSGNIKDPSLINILYECRNRISSMALIHQKLYESRSFSSINITEYIQELITSLISTYQLRNCKVVLDFPPDDLHLTIENAIPLGLILNELVTNSLKHAFTNSDKGEIFVSLKKKKGNHINISMADNGSGFPKEVDFYKPDTLGLQLVHTLIKQLNGEIKLMPTAGTNVKIEIPDDSSILK